jgi:prepilin-type N-terminal cleavage/methylation domain-containing protein
MSRHGFTLIELLIVVVIIGLLAAIAIPKYSNTKEKAVLASMKADLRNLATIEESYFSDNHVYAPDVTALQAPPYAFNRSGQNSITVAQLASGAAWRATGTNVAVALTCTLSSHTETADDGVVTC